MRRLLAIGLVMILIFAATSFVLTQVDPKVSDRVYALNLFLREFDRLSNSGMSADECFENILDQGLKACDRYAGISVGDREIDDFDARTGNDYGGVGTTIISLDSAIIFVPYVDSPADSAGILPGDILIRVDSVEINSALSISDVANFIRGSEGTSVSIFVNRDGVDVGPLTIIRQIIQPINAIGAMVGSDIGYVRIMNFGKSLSDDFSSAVNRLDSLGMLGLVIDLRNNPGGRVDETLDALELFSTTPRNIAITFKNRGVVDRIFRTNWIGKYSSLPVVVIANEFSASASEIFAGALQSWGVADIVGDTTYGKGSAQSVFGGQTPSGVNFMYRFTTEEWFVGNDEIKIDGVGVMPDYIIDPAPLFVNPMTPLGRLEIDLSIDECLREAIRVLKDQI